MRSAIARTSMYGLGLVLLIGSVSTPVFAGLAPATPEIDGGTLSAGLAGLTAAVLILRSRRRSK